MRLDSKRTILQATTLVAAALLLVGSASAVTARSSAPAAPGLAAGFTEITPPPTAEKVPLKLDRPKAGTVASARKSAPVAATAATGSSADRAQAILASLKARYPILRGTTVEYGNARGFQAIAYFQSGRIVISRTHTASLERIIEHEIWHIIDWRDNNRIDWRENVPPANAASFAE